MEQTLRKLVLVISSTVVKVEMSSTFPSVPIKSNNFIAIIFQ